MIPDHIIDKAAAAIYQDAVMGAKFATAWHDMADDNPIKARTRELATAALKPTAADFWDQGFLMGEFFEHNYGSDASVDYPDNPYRASETA